MCGSESAIILLHFDKTEVPSFYFFESLLPLPFPSNTEDIISAQD